MSFKSIFEKYDVYKECPNCKNKSLIELEEGLFVCDNCGKEYKGSLEESVLNEGPGAGWEKDVDESLKEARASRYFSPVFSNPKEYVKKCLKGEVKSPYFRHLSSNGESGEVELDGTTYAFRKLPNGDYKVMTSQEAGWNWSETLFKDESLKESWSDASYKDYESINKFVRENNGPGFIELVNCEDGPLDTSIITVEIEGDWKHDHDRFDYLVEQWAEKNGRKIIKIDVEVIEDTEEDWYPAQHTIYIAKDDESYDMLNKMRPLFANESLKEAFNADTVKKRISSYKESDNGHRLFKYYDWTSDEAEEKAKQASIKDPTDVYYVKYDDIMNPCSDVRWYKGNSYLNESLDEKLDESLTLYRGYQKSFYRWDAVDNGFRLDSNGEIDFTSDPEVAAGYGWFGLRIKVQGLKFKKVSSYSVADRESIIDEGFDGVQQHDQFYIFNVDKLNNNIIEKHAYTIAGTDIGLVINKTPNTTAPRDIKRNTLCYIKGKIFNSAWGHKIYFNDEEYVLCKTHDDSGHASVVVYSTECAELNNRTGTYCTAPLSEVMLYTNASDESLSEDTSYSWKPDTSFKHIKSVLDAATARGKYVNNEREEVLAALDRADKKGYTPEQRKYIKDKHMEMWKKNNSQEESLKERYSSDQVILPAALRKKLNNLCYKYSGFKLPQEVAPLWDELYDLGIEVLIQGPPQDVAADGAKSWTVPFQYNGETVDNSRFVYSVYEGSNSLKNDYNMYFS